eukprot:4319151-Prymnesium_polylepis.1
MQTKGFYFSNALNFGRATYVATGRGFQIDTISFVDLYGRYAQSHIYMGFEIGVYLTIFQLVSVQDSSTLWVSTVPVRSDTYTRLHIPALPPTATAASHLHLTCPTALAFTAGMDSRRRAHALPVDLQSRRADWPGGLGCLPGVALVGGWRHERHQGRARLVVEVARTAAQDDSRGAGREEAAAGHPLCTATPDDMRGLRCALAQLTHDGQAGAKRGHRFGGAGRLCAFCELTPRTRPAA